MGLGGYHYSTRHIVLGVCSATPPVLFTRAIASVYRLRALLRCFALPGGGVDKPSDRQRVTADVATVAKKQRDKSSKDDTEPNQPIA